MDTLGKKLRAIQLRALRPLLNDRKLLGFTNFILDEVYNRAENGDSEWCAWYPQVDAVFGKGFSGEIATATIIEALRAFFASQDVIFTHETSNVHKNDYNLFYFKLTWK
jgi:hypothetical protein